jgi:hypothetical protein
MFWKIGLGLGLLLLGAGELPVSTKVGDYLQYGALGILFLSILLQYWQADRREKSNNNFNDKLLAQHAAAFKGFGDLKNHCSEVLAPYAAKSAARKRKRRNIHSHNNADPEG